MHKKRRSPHAVGSGKRALNEKRFVNRIAQKYQEEPEHLQHILDLLRGVEVCGDGYKALCPAHDDNEPSLSINLGEEERVLLYCHAGCDIESIVRSLGLRLPHLFHPDTRPQRIRRGRGRGMYGY